MNVSKEFIDLLYSAKNQQNYIGMGNPNASILIIGREPAHDLKTEEGRNGFHQGQELNRSNWRNLLEDKPIEGRCNPRHPFPNQRCLRDRSRDKKRPIINNGTAITWVWYQKLVDQLLGRIDERDYKFRPVDFHDFCFHTDISAAAAKNLSSTNKEYKFASVQERSRELFSHSFFKQFPIIILAIGNDIGKGKYVPLDWCEQVLGFPTTEVEQTLSIDKKWININRDSKGGRILIHTQSLSQPSKEYIKKIRDIIWQEGKAQFCIPSVNS